MNLIRRILAIFKIGKPKVYYYEENSVYPFAPGKFVKVKSKGCSRLTQERFSKLALAKQRCHCGKLAIYGDTDLEFLCEDHFKGYTRNVR